MNEIVFWEQEDDEVSFFLWRFVYKAPTKSPRIFSRDINNWIWVH
jgi:hypothetical protein